MDFFLLFGCWKHLAVTHGCKPSTITRHIENYLKVKNPEEQVAFKYNEIFLWIPNLTINGIYIMLRYVGI